MARKGIKGEEGKEEVEGGRKREEWKEGERGREGKEKGKDRKRIGKTKCNKGGKGMVKKGQK